VKIALLPVKAASSITPRTVAYLYLYQYQYQYAHLADAFVEA
jgi:hypothetical protein